MSLWETIYTVWTWLLHMERFFIAETILQKYCSFWPRNSCAIFHLEHFLRVCRFTARRIVSAMANSRGAFGEIHQSLWVIVWCEWLMCLLVFLSPESFGAEIRVLRLILNTDSNRGNIRFTKPIRRSQYLTIYHHMRHDVEHVSGVNACLIVANNDEIIGWHVLRLYIG